MANGKGPSTAQQQAALDKISTTHKIDRYTLWDMYRFDSGSAMPQNVKLFSQGQGNGDDVVTPGVGKTPFTTNMLGDGTLPENELVIFTRFWKFYTPRKAFTFTDDDDPFTNSGANHNDDKYLMEDIRRFEAAVGGAAPWLRIGRGGAQDLYLELPWFQIPAGSVVSNNAINNSSVNETYLLSEKAPLILKDRLRLTVDINMITPLAADTFDADVILGLAFEGYRFRPIFPEGMAEEGFKQYWNQL